MGEKSYLVLKKGESGSGFIEIDSCKNWAEAKKIALELKNKFPFMLVYIKTSMRHLYSIRKGIRKDYITFREY